MTTHEWWVLWAAGALAVVVFTAAGLTWRLHWQCVDGFWHWRKECDGHDDGGGLEVGWQIDPPLGDDGRAIMLPRLGASFGGTLFIDKETGEGHWEHWHKDAPDDAEAALDEAWPDTLHAINTDLHQPAPDILGLDELPWGDRMVVEQWDWRQRRIAERKAHRLDCGLEWRDDMGLAA